MARAYALDLRKKVMVFIGKGGGKSEAARVFNRGEDTIYRWLRLEKAGDLSAKRRTHFTRKVSDETLRSYVNAHPDHTLEEISLAVHLSISNVWKHLKRLRITRKKRRRFMQNDVLKNEMFSWKK